MIDTGMSYALAPKADIYQIIKLLVEDYQITCKEGGKI
jgi:hypothetical protein